MADAGVNELVKKVFDMLWSVAQKEISYMYNCSDNVETLKKEVENLRVTTGRFQQHLNAANHEGDNTDALGDWMKRANKVISEADEFVVKEAGESKKRWFNWRTLHRNGKLAVANLSSVQDLIKLAKDFGSQLSVPTAEPEFLDVYEPKTLDDLKTQKLALKEITDAIRNEKIQIIGIHGAGGVGKTVLAHEAAREVRKEFADIIYLTVSQNANVEKLKEAAKRAAKRILDNKNILVILDDMWKEQNLYNLGIPHGAQHKNCKILLTSRSLEVCLKMNAHCVPVDRLTEKEAWNLFKRVVGEKVDTNETSKKIAEKAVHECGGLPLIVEVVGKIFQKQKTNLWEVTLDQLENNAPSVIPMEIRGAFTNLKLSYDLLESEEAKLCFLLCSMFPEDELVPLECLARYVVGLGKFNRLRSLQDARNRVQIAIETLKSCSLLLNGIDKFTTKMHDLVREVAHLIASDTNKINFLVEAGIGLENWIPRKNDPKDYTGISVMRNNICMIPDYVHHFPKLDLFLIQENRMLSKIPDEFMECIKEVKVLDMEHNNISSLPKSMIQLIKLRMLNLGGNRSIKEISVLGELEDLEILILNDTSIKEIPQEIGKLENLRRLEVKRCPHLSHIAHGVISKLRWLEELCIGYYPLQKENNKSLMELGNLLKLTYLDLFVTDYVHIPEKVQFRKLNKFVIKIGNNDSKFSLPWELQAHRLLILGKSSAGIPDFIHRELISVSDCILLLGMTKFNHILPNMYYEGSKELKTIALYQCYTGSCLVDNEYCTKRLRGKEIEENDQKDKEGKFLSRLQHIKLSSLTMLEVLWTCPHNYISLRNLVTLYIDDCSNLVRLLPMTVTRGLHNLEKLSITNCPRLEEVIDSTDEDIVTDDIEFPSLSHIFLSDLRKLKSFSSEIPNIKYPSLVNVSIIRCSAMTKWGDGIHTAPILKSVGNVQLDKPKAINDAVRKHYEEHKSSHRRHLESIQD